MKASTPLRRLAALLACLCGAGLGGHVLAQEVGDAPAPEVEANSVFVAHDTLAFAASELDGARTVKGAPYCADAVSESIQSLADGNRIVRRQSTRLCRDGEGRTRQEVELNGTKRVFLRDPVAREHWLLDPERKTAKRLSSHGGMGALPAPDGSVWREYSDRMRDYAERMREWGRNLGERMRHEFSPRDAPVAGDATAAPPIPPTPPVPPAPALISPPGAGADAQREMHVQVLRMDGKELPAPAGAAPWAVPLPPLVALRSQQLAPRGAGVVNSLGSKDIEGLRADGERTTWTIEAGKFGNEKPIVITREVWTSPELMLTLSSRDFDPRSGEVLYRLVNLKRGEPDAALMRVPGDFDVRSKAKPKPPAVPASKG